MIIQRKTSEILETSMRPKFGFLLAMLSALASFSLADFASATEPLQSSDWLYRIGRDPTGEKVVEVKWTVRSLGNIKIVRIPWNYRSLLLGTSDGAQLIDNVHKESRDNGYAGVFSFSAILPEIKPHTGIEPHLLDREKRGEIARGLVYNVVNKKYPTWDERRVFTSFIDIYRSQLYSGPERLQIALVPKSTRFDLNRIGPERFVVEEWRKNTRLGGGLYRDMWFDGNTPEDSHSVIVCGSDERADGTLDPENGPYHMCEHFFTVEKLTARVKLSYRKGYLKNWREIRTRVDALLSSFLTD